MTKGKKYLSSSSYLENTKGNCVLYKTVHGRKRFRSSEDVIPFLKIKNDNADLLMENLRKRFSSKEKAEIKRYEKDFDVVPLLTYASIDNRCINYKIGIYKNSSEIVPGQDVQSKIDIMDYRNRNSINISYVLKTIPHYRIQIRHDYPKKGNEEWFYADYSSINKKSDIKKLGRFVSIDIQTTSTNLSAGIVELVGIKFENFIPVELFSTLIKPGCKIPTKVQEIHHITDAMVIDKPSIKDVAQSFMEFVGDYDILGHCLYFDLNVLASKGVSFGKRKYYDTYDLASNILNRPELIWNDETCDYDYDDSDADIYNYRLDTLCNYYSFTKYGICRGENNAMATAMIFKYMCDEIIDCE